MLLYNVKYDKTIGSHAVNIEEVVVGQTYRLYEEIQRGMYRGKLNTYFIESVYSKVLLMTKPDGSKPFAIATNDCERDGFGPFELARILVEQGNYVIYGYQSPDNKFEPARFIAFQVTDTHPAEKYEMQTIEIRATHKFDALSVPSIFNDVTNHAVSVMGSTLEEQLLPKYCFNPNRLITLRLFEKNETDEVCSYHSNGNKLVLNANSKERKIHLPDNDKRVVSPGMLMRVFFSRKFKDSKHIFVDGKTLSPIRKWDLDTYIEDSQMDVAIAHSLIKEIVTKNDQKYYAITNHSGEIRPLYKSTNGFSSFPLNEKELTFIKDVNVITSWV